jgi:hypothetical protein
MSLVLSPIARELFAPPPQTGHLEPPQADKAIQAATPKIAIIEIRFLGAFIKMTPLIKRNFVNQDPLTVIDQAQTGKAASNRLAIASPMHSPPLKSLTYD